MGRLLAIIIAVAGLAAGCALTASSLHPEASALADTTAASPAVQYGYSLGNVADKSAADQDAILSAIASVAPGGFVRTDFKWVKGGQPDWARYDAFAARVMAHGLRWLPTVHPTKSGGGGYAIPTTSEWQTQLRALFDHYGPTGTFTAANPAWVPVKEVELWNEPQTGTGNAGGTMTVATAVRLVKTGAGAVHAYAGNHGFKATVLGPALGGIDLAYLKQMVAADPAVLSYLDVLTVHIYMSEDPTLPGGESFKRRIRTLETLRSYMDANGGASTAIGMTEGGYSGRSETDGPVNTVSEQTQADWGLAAAQWAADFGIAYYSPYNPIDAGTATWDGKSYDYSFWYENLGAVRADGTLKPWGQAYLSLTDPPTDPICP